ncbi:MAG: O-methyltransferase [Chitinophagales bacterium]|nr:MAG: O-methyltransferase [Chitinophagales bacterium]
MIQQEEKTRITFFSEKERSAIEAKEKAQFIAFAPIIFKVTLALRNLGVLEKIAEAQNGFTLKELQKQTGLSPYALRVMTDGGVQAGVLYKDSDGRFHLTKTGHFILYDRMTTVNLDFNNDVCYRGFTHIERALLEGSPAGLTELGPWKTIYEGLSQLPERVRSSWFAFDHFYSDDVFDKVLPIIFKQDIRKLLDIGGNTGKFAAQCVSYSPTVEVTIVDLPGQIQIAKQEISQRSEAERVHYYEADMLQESSHLPEGFDAIWMSQFLDCFAPDEIILILKKCKQIMNTNTRVYILEPFTDLQRFEASAFVLEMTSLYFTVMANGNSRMYNSSEMKTFVNHAGLQVEEIISGLGICQSLMICRI